MSEPRLAPYQFNAAEAAEYAESGRWEALTPEQRGLLQLRQDRLCMTFSAFHEGITKLLGRDVYTHEFAQPDLLWEEYQGVREKPSFQQIIDKLPEHLRGSVIIVTGGGDG